ncbi:tumor necrosis factor ligand superfamily member 4 [Emys orbicularis]|uniref:tumor necrosis factor ligand superfamily member 4 n=1 Tax=Emys orbicularis TaxID=82168 RepID=UPI0031FE380E
MNVRNLSIPIYCDGFYLVSLKGTIRAMSQRNASLSLKVYKRSDASILCVKVTEEVVDLVTVSEMRFKDEVYLEANRDANYKDLTLGLFLLTPRSHCLPDAYKM